MKDEELNRVLDGVNPERNDPHPTLGIKHKYVDLMRKFGGMDDPRRMKKAAPEEEEKKDALLQLNEYPSP